MPELLLDELQQVTTTWVGVFSLALNVAQTCFLAWLATGRGRLPH